MKQKEKKTKTSKVIHSIPPEETSLTVTGRNRRHATTNTPQQLVSVPFKSWYVNTVAPPRPFKKKKKEKDKNNKWWYSYDWEAGKLPCWAGAPCGSGLDRLPWKFRDITAEESHESMAWKESKRLQIISRSLLIFFSVWSGWHVFFLLLSFSAYKANYRTVWQSSGWEMTFPSQLLHALPQTSVALWKKKKVYVLPIGETCTAVRLSNTFFGPVKFWGSWICWVTKTPVQEE